nr:39S ribosomal protein L30 mitochondrial [Hymenolepis microstoma]
MHASTPSLGKARTYESKPVPGSIDAIDPLAWAQRLFDLHEIRKNYTYSPDSSPIFMICRLKPIKGTTFFERAFLETYGIGSDVKIGNWKLVKNSPQNAKNLDHIKHLIKIQPVTFPDGLPESEADMLNFRLLPNGKFIRRGNSPFRSDKPINISEWKIVEQPKVEGSNLPDTLKCDENYRYLTRSYLRGWHNQRWQHHQLFSEFFTAKYKYRLNQDGLEYRYNGLWRLDDAMRQSLNHRRNTDGTYRTNNNSRFEADWGIYPWSFY